MSAVSVAGEALLPTPFDKMAWLERVCGKRVDGPQFICCCGHNFGDGSGKDKGKAKTWVVEPNTGKAAPQKHPTRPLAPKWDSQKSVIALGLKAASKSTSSTYTILHQRSPEAPILQPCRAGVEVLHVPPRRREACHFVGSEQNRSQHCEIRRHL